jgi:hypothetical protein
MKAGSDNPRVDVVDENNIVKMSFVEFIYYLASSENKPATHGKIKYYISEEVSITLENPIYEIVPLERLWFICGKSY